MRCPARPPCLPSRTSDQWVTSCDVSGSAVLPTAAGPCRHRTGLPPLRPRATSGAEPSKAVGGAEVPDPVPSGTETTFGKAGGGVGHRITITVNGTAHTAEVEPRTLLVHLLREQLGSDGDPHRLRHLELRRVHRPDGRRDGPVVLDARRPGRRRIDHDGRGALDQRRAPPDPARVPRATRAPVRVSARLA